jgi:tRNA U34 5-carboxymethylaminomethyl modifying GTPase MnmE/TrmE
MIETAISKPIHKILVDLTGETRFDVALHVATKDLVRLKLKEVEEQRKRFEERYQMDFEAFKQAWNEDQISNKRSYEVERDYWEWEAAVTDERRLRETLEELRRDVVSQSSSLKSSDIINRGVKMQRKRPGVVADGAFNVDLEVKSP